jgi:hypothetical protein
MKVLELSYNAERHELQQLYTIAKQLDEAKLYTSTYNKTSLQGGEQLQVVQASQPNRAPTRAGIRSSRMFDTKAQPWYKQAILVAVSRPPIRAWYPIAAKIAARPRPG